MSGEIDPLLFQATLIVMGVTTFSFVFSSFYYYCSSSGSGIDDIERDLYSRRGDRFWLLGYTLAVGSAWLALWLVYLVFVIRFFPKIQMATRPK